MKNKRGGDLMDIAWDFLNAIIREQREAMEIERVTRLCREQEELEQAGDIKETDEYFEDKYPKHPDDREGWSDHV